MPRRIRVKKPKFPEETYNDMLVHFERLGYGLFDYQEVGVKFMLERETNPKFRRAGLLCDEPGLGKTIQTGALMYMNDEKTLLVLPKCVLPQWRDFLSIIFPDIGIYVHHGIKRCLNITELKKELITSDIVLTTYGMLGDLLPKIKWGRIIYDEIHILRNSGTSRAQNAMKMRSKSYWGLTGTPVNNRIDDLRTIYKILHFPDAVLERKVSDYFSDLNAKYIMRRTKKQVEEFNPHLCLPDLNIKIVETSFRYTEERTTHRNVMEWIFDNYGDIGEHELIPLEYYMRMRQGCIHPRLVDMGLGKKWGVEIPEEDYEVKSTKFEIIREMMTEHEDEKTLIFCHYVLEMALLRRVLEKDGWQVFQIDGSKSMVEREMEIADCRDTRMKAVMLIQIVAGSVGMNLQFASRVYFTSPHYNPSVEIQAMARAHRIGQVRPVHVVKLVIVEDGFVEDTILEIQTEKRSVMSSVLNDKTLLDGGTRVRI